jgi:hypothetical protein
MTFDSLASHPSIDVRYFYRVPVAKQAAIVPKPRDNELSEWLSVVVDDGLLFPEERKLEVMMPVTKVEVSQAQHMYAGDAYACESPSGSVKRLHSAMSDETAGSNKSLNRGMSSGDETVSSNKSLNRGMRTAMEVFQQFTRVYVDSWSGHQVVDVRDMISRECYEAWLESRKQTPLRPEECFRKCILAHLTATDGGSAPFPEPVETALLDLLRQRKPWPCFQGYKDKKGNPMNIGHKGLRATGYHEKRREEELAMRQCML